MTDENMNTQPTIEQEIQVRASNAPRVTLADIEAEIASEYYFTAREGAWASQGLAGEAMEKFTLPQSLSLLTFCVLVLRNGFTVTGESACVSPENFDAEIGRKIARQNAIAKMWPLMGFALADSLMELKLIAESEGQTE